MQNLREIIEIEKINFIREHRLVQKIRRNVYKPSSITVIKRKAPAISVGIPPDYSEGSWLLDQLETICYKAKENGR